MDKPTTLNFEGAVCPVPHRHKDKILLGHGSGGRLTHDLIERIFLPHFSNSLLNEGNDFASIPSSSEGGRLAVSTDAHIVSPIFFPGGDIGKLAVCGTINDVAMSGAIPLYLTASFILEEGLSIDSLEQIIISMENSAREAGIKIIAGDTKVVEKGKADGCFISTTGFGWIPAGVNIGGQFAQPGDTVLVSGTLGDHGIAVLSARGDLGLETIIQSDVAPLNSMIVDLLAAAPDTHVLRDPTRGGLATTLNEIACQSDVCIRLYEENIPVHPSVRAVCELLGFDPLYMANEGKLIAIVPPAQSSSALQAMQAHPFGGNAMRIGVVEATPNRKVLLQISTAGTRILDMLSGEMLPRIC
jgi:hydrogenase expression/formation protein HypE